MIRKQYYFVVAIVLLVVVLFHSYNFKKKLYPSDVALLQMLITTEIWSKTTIFNYSGLPVQTYNNLGDKNSHYYTRLLDNFGNNYYVSYPPLSYYLPYFLFQLGFSQTNITIQVLNILLHLFSIVLLYLIIKKLFNTVDSKLLFVSLLIFGITPVMIHSFGKVYFAETLGLFFWIVSILALLRLIKNEKQSKLDLAFYGFSLFLLTYTEWTGVLMLFSLIFVKNFFRTKVISPKIIVVSTISVIFPLLIWLMQLLSIASIEDITHGLGIRFIERSGWFGETYSSDGVSVFNFASWKIFLINFSKSIQWYGWLIIIATVIVLFNKKNILNNANSYLVLIVVIILIVTLKLHTFLFFNANALHFHLQAKWLMLISILFIFVIKEYSIFINNYFLSILTCLIILTCILYKHEKPIENLFLKEISKQIKQNTTSEMVLLAHIESEQPMPYNLTYLTYNCKRNFSIWSDTAHFSKLKNSSTLKHAYIYANQFENKGFIVVIDQYNSKVKTTKWN